MSEAADRAADKNGAKAAKSASAFRTISEVADELEVAQHVLRFWESKFPQVRPLKRGGGRRYYRPEDLETLREIRSLLYEEGYTIKGAQKHLRAKRGGGADDGAAGVAVGSSSRRQLEALRKRLRSVRDGLSAAFDDLR